MNKNSQYMMIAVCALSLSSCMVVDDNISREYVSYTYNPSPIYSQAYYSDNYNYGKQSSQPVVTVPDSYHVGQNHSPVSFKDRDQIWVQEQNPQSYTIEIASGDKASNVARQLYNTPKNNRMAQVQFQKNGNVYYRGLYGSYDSPEAAQKALDSLPSDIKRSAGVKQWSSVQHD